MDGRAEGRTIAATPKKKCYRNIRGFYRGAGGQEGVDVHFCMVEK